MSKIPTLMHFRYLLECLFTRGWNFSKGKAAVLYKTVTINQLEALDLFSTTHDFYVTTKVKFNHKHRKSQVNSFPFYKHINYPLNYMSCFDFSFSNNYTVKFSAILFTQVTTSCFLENCTCHSILQIKKLILCHY